MVDKIDLHGQSFLPTRFCDFLRAFPHFIFVSSKRGNAKQISDVAKTNNMAFRKRFVVSTEDVNTKGFWVVTKGIDLKQAKVNCPAYYNHRTWDIPLGHWENIAIENNQLLADLVIEGGNEIETEYIRKIENGDIKGASIGADPIAWETSEKYVKPGQWVATLSKCSLFEISLTPLPANQSSLALSHKGSLINLSDGNADILPLLQNKQTDMKQIALKLGLPEDATEAQVLEKIGSIQLSLQTIQAFQDSILKKAEVGLSDEAKKLFVTLSKVDPAQALQFAEMQNTKSPEENEDPAKVVTLTKDFKVTQLIQRQGGGADDGKDTYDYLQKHNPAELARIKREDNARYIQLAKDYGAGVRYSGK